MNMIQQENSSFQIKKSCSGIFVADCLYGLDRRWANDAHHVHIVQVHALFTNPKTHKIVPNGWLCSSRRMPHISERS